MRVEISVENNNEEFEHEGYYDSIQDAINALYDLYLISYLSGELECSPGKKYKRDPPDGGYYD